MKRAFGGGYSRTEGYVTAAEVDRALVRAVDRGSLALHLARITSPDGWDPRISRQDGFEVVARELGLRYNRAPTQERFESDPGEPMRQAETIPIEWQSPSSSGQARVTSRLRPPLEKCHDFNEVAYAAASGRGIPCPLYEEECPPLVVERHLSDGSERPQFFESLFEILWNRGRLHMELLYV